jgi:hypothetical protein
MFPIKYNAVWEMYKKAEASFWTGAWRIAIRPRRGRSDDAASRDAFRLLGEFKRVRASLKRGGRRQCVRMNSETDDA